MDGKEIIPDSPFGLEVYEEAEPKACPIELSVPAEQVISALYEAGGAAELVPNGEKIEVAKLLANSQPGEDGYFVIDISHLSDKTQVAFGAINRVMSIKSYLIDDDKVLTDKILGSNRQVYRVLNDLFEPADSVLTEIYKLHTCGIFSVQDIALFVQWVDAYTEYLLPNLGFSKDLIELNQQLHALSLRTVSDNVALDQSNARNKDNDRCIQEYISDNAITDTDGLLVTTLGIIARLQLKLDQVHELEAEYDKATSKLVEALGYFRETYEKQGGMTRTQADELIDFAVQLYKR